MKLVNKMYYLVLALAVVFTLNNCSQEEITSQDVELNKSTNDVLAKKKVSSANGQAGYEFPFGFQNLAFHVSMDADGNVSGSWQSNYNDIDDDAFDINTHGVIQCATFVGDNRVTMSGTITHLKAGSYWTDGVFRPAVEVGQFAAFAVIDNGEGKNAEPDQFIDVIFNLDELFCFDAPAFLQFVDITNGNIQVNN